MVSQGFFSYFRALPKELLYTTIALYNIKQSKKEDQKRLYLLVRREKYEKTKKSLKFFVITLKS